MEPAASFSQSLGPFRATATPFMPKSMESACYSEQYIPRKQTRQGGRVSATLAPLFFLTHLDFFARPWYIDIFQHKITFQYCGRVSGLANFQICPEARFLGWALWGYIARTIYFQDNVFSEQRPYTSRVRSLILELPVPPNSGGTSITPELLSRSREQGIAPIIQKLTFEEKH